jgi:histidyl-tRNA synthetase
MSAPTRIAPAAFLKLSADVASSYGFRTVREWALEKPRGAHSFASVAHAGAARFATRPTEPVLAFYATPTPSHVPTGILPREVGEVGLQVIGAPESVGEIVLLKTIAAIASEWGTPVSRVRVNALGDKDSKMRFARELSLYLRKHSQRLCETCRSDISRNPFTVYGCMNESCRAVASEGPRPMNFLSEKSRVHFREVLEHLEGLGLPYELDDLLVGDEREPRTPFALDLENEDATVVTSIGGRYDDYLRRITNKKDGHAVHASMFFRKKGLATSNFSSNTRVIRPKVYFIQLGLRAKLQGLSVLDTLRHARVPVLQSFDATRLQNQLSAAETAGVSHLLIMGQREALDNTVIVRTMRNRSQQIVQLSQLPSFLKTIK